MIDYLVLAPNSEAGHVFLGVYEAENAKDAVRQVKDGDYQNASTAQEQSAKHGTQFEVHQINRDATETVFTRDGEIDEVV